MGSCCSSGAGKSSVPLIENGDGDEMAYRARYIEEEVLGEGEFGVVKLVREKQSKEPKETSSHDSVYYYACKILRKGMVFKDNTFYSPLKPEILRGEIAMLRKLKGDMFCLKLYAVYESHRTIYVITQYCSGGEMVEYVSRLSPNHGLSIPDASRMAYQLLSAIHHCHTHQIIHRDVKPENVLFETSEPQSNLRLIDFGSGTICHQDTDDELFHTTFAGSAFYISPEMFQRKYNSLTDVWSVGATLYVLVAGYPADDLQKAFNVLQSSQRKQLQQSSLPNLPNNLPSSYYELLEACLTYKYQQRPTAKELLQYEFVQLHQQQQQKVKEPEDTEISLSQVAEEAALASKQIEGSVVRHNLVLGFQQFERSLTALLATLLSKKELEILLQALSQRTTIMTLPSTSTLEDEKTEEETKSNANQQENTNNNNEIRLSVCKVGEIKEILQTQLNNPQILETMAKIPNMELYENFAYHTALLGDWNHGNNGLGTNVASLSASLGRRRRRMVMGSNYSKEDGSVRSTGSGRGRNLLFSKRQNNYHHSVSGGNVFSSFPLDQ